jgi:uncharacterized protein DUF3300
MNASGRVLASLFALVLGIALLPAPTTAQQASSAFKPEELDQLVAPIALHPDALLAQILIASTYPLEVVQAARFVKENTNLKGDPLNEALKQYNWDDSVKSLVFFPQVLTMMNDKLDWLQKLGDAFLAQQQDVMASIQRLRARAEAAGKLKSTPEQTVIVEPAAAPAVPAPPSGTPPPPAGAAPGAPPPTVQTLPAPGTVQVVQTPPTVIRIEPANPQVVYVPSYDPTVVYGAFPPAYPPYYPYPPGYFAAGVFTFAAGAAVGAALWGGADWNHGDVNINNNRANNFTNNVNNTNNARERVSQRPSSGAGGDRGKWQHNPEHRGGAQYRDAATQQRFNKSGPANAQSREAFRGRTTGPGSESGRGGQQGGIGQASTRDRQGGIGQGGTGQRGGAGQAGIGQGGAGQARQSGGFEGMGSGRDAQSFSNRGNASRESARSSGGGSRGGASAGGGSRGGGGGSRGGGGSSGGGGSRGGGGRR